MCRTPAKLVLSGRKNKEASVSSDVRQEYSRGHHGDTVPAEGDSGCHHLNKSGLSIRDRERRGGCATGLSPSGKGQYEQEQRLWPHDLSGFGAAQQ